jgi:D-alanyl-D-alanine dipeptidase
MKRKQKPVKFIPDSELVKVPVRDNGEPLVKIKDFVTGLVFRAPKYIRESGKRFVDQASTVRIGVAEKLALARKLLPPGHNFFLRSAYRSLTVQRKTYQKTFDKIRKNNPEWSLDRLKEEVSKFVAPLDIIPPHSTGGAVDISIIGPNGRQLDMGTKIGQDTDLEKTRTDSNKISAAAIKNRELLIRVMTAVGFINYPTEWWHWSYGDQYWAAELKKKYSIYDGI